MSDLRLESLRAWRDLENYNVPEGQWFQPTASEVASVLSDADLLGELVRRGVLVKDWGIKFADHGYTIRATALDILDALAAASKDSNDG